jgi:hypothetical protein
MQALLQQNRGGGSITLMTYDTLYSDVLRRAAAARQHTHNIHRTILQLMSVACSSAVGEPREAVSPAHCSPGN